MLGSSAAGRIMRAGKARAARQTRKQLPRAEDGVAGLQLPPELDATRLLNLASEHFMRLQAAWDACDQATLRALTTPQMYSELCEQLPLQALTANRTDVLSLQPRLLAFDDFGSAWLATVEFSGMVCEQPERGAEPFRELWLLTCEQVSAAPAPAWRLARQQTLL